MKKCCIWTYHSSTMVHWWELSHSGPIHTSFFLCELRRKSKSKAAYHHHFKQNHEKRCKCDIVKYLIWMQNNFSYDLSRTLLLFLDVCCLDKLFIRLKTSSGQCSFFSIFFLGEFSQFREKKFRKCKKKQEFYFYS
jgi:hypothetical protein